MINNSVISDIYNNINPGVEYEIALFYCLLLNTEEKEQVQKAYSRRNNASKIKAIIDRTDISNIINEITSRGLILYDCSFETQNDSVGPADIVMYLKDSAEKKKRIGLSVKYENTCTLNVTGRRFITEQQITKLKQNLPLYTKKYIEEMNHKYGDIQNWFRKRKPSKITDEYIDLIRDSIIANWSILTNKEELIKSLYHSDSPIEFWIFKYTINSSYLNSTPITIKQSKVNLITIEKYKTSYIAFYLEGEKIGHMQVKFNNGFIEKCKKQQSDLIVDDIKMSYGQPFSSWNFCIEE
jgi:hypothetical protein